MCEMGIANFHFMSLLSIRFMFKFKINLKFQDKESFQTYFHGNYLNLLKDIAQDSFACSHQTAVTFCLHQVNPLRT